MAEIKLLRDIWFSPANLTNSDQNSSSSEILVRWPAIVTDRSLSTKYFPSLGSGWLYRVSTRTIAPQVWCYCHCHDVLVGTRSWPLSQRFPFLAIAYAEYLGATRIQANIKILRPGLFFGFPRSIWAVTRFDRGAAVKNGVLSPSIQVDS